VAARYPDQPLGHLSEGLSMDSATRVATRWAASNAGSSAEDHLKVLNKLLTREITGWEVHQSLPTANSNFCKALSDVAAALKELLKSNQGTPAHTTISHLPANPKSSITYWYHLRTLITQLTVILTSIRWGGLSYQKELTEILEQLEKLHNLLGC
jgi:hypothetical protein